jgi:hypothetical protein
MARRLRSIDSGGSTRSSWRARSIRPSGAVFPGRARERIGPWRSCRIFQTPDGFHLQFHTDGTSYLFALKDTMDRCRFSIFSDEDGDIYEAIARPNMRVIPLDSQ